MLNGFTNVVYTILFAIRVPIILARYTQQQWLILAKSHKDAASRHCLSSESSSLKHDKRLTSFIHQTTLSSFFNPRLPKHRISSKIMRSEQLRIPNTVAWAMRISLLSLTKKREQVLDIETRESGSSSEATNPFLAINLARY